MKVFGVVLKVLAALAVIAGVVYVIATYGDKILAKIKKLLGRGKTCGCGDCDGCQCNDNGECLCEFDCDECECCKCECDDEDIEDVEEDEE